MPSGSWLIVSFSLSLSLYLSPLLFSCKAIPLTIDGLRELLSKGRDFKDQEYIKDKGQDLCIQV